MAPLDPLVLVVFATLALILVGFGLGYLYVRNRQRPFWHKFIVLMTAPTVSVLLFACYLDPRFLLVYVVSALVGFVAEFCLGFAYHTIMGTKLWKYDANAYPLLEYTSWLTLPMWGVAGIVFWTVSKLVGM